MDQPERKTPYTEEEIKQSEDLMEKIRTLTRKTYEISGPSSGSMTMTKSTPLGDLNLLFERWSESKKRPIAIMREVCPDTTWRYDLKGATWNSEAGHTVYRTSVLAPTYDGDEDTFVSYWRVEHPDGHAEHGPVLSALLRRDKR